MKELTDYSGEFDPNIRYEDFSKNSLLELLNAYSDYIRKLDGFWYLMVKDRMGDDEAFACDTNVWEKMYAIEFEMTRKLFKIKGNDVAALMKAFQMSPWTRTYRHSMELQSPHYGILTVTHCPTLLALEREGSVNSWSLNCSESRRIFSTRRYRCGHSSSPPGRVKMRSTASGSLSWSPRNRVGGLPSRTALDSNRAG